MLTKPAPVLHCDWLQLHIKRVDKINHAFHHRYKVKKLEFGTRHFKLIEEIFIGERRIATLTSMPHSNILDADSLIVKFDNWVCYDHNFRHIVNEFLKLNGFYFIACSRVDLCADFNLFANGMHPDKFIKKYIYRKLLKEGKARKVRHTFSQESTRHDEEGLSFGSKLSEITYYLYDKTKELNEVVYKPYIVEAWRKGGLDLDAGVWRLEFSLKSGAKLLVNSETGEFDLFATLKIVEKDYILKAYSVLYFKYFQFVWNDGQQRKDRMRQLKLFEFSRCSEILVGAMGMKDADRSKKIFIKKLHELNNELRGSDFYMCEYGEEFKKRIIDDGGLQTWAMLRGLN